MCNSRCMFRALFFLAVAAPAGGVDTPRPNDSVDVQMQCNTIVGVFEVDPVAARALLPVQYELKFQPSGNALVYLQASNCDGSGNGVNLGGFDLADAWLVIEGPYEVVDNPLADFSTPTDYVYVLKAQTTSKWVKTHCAAIYFPKEIIRFLDVGGPISPGRTGYVIEMTGRSYSWAEVIPCMTTSSSDFGQCWMFPDYPIPVGFNSDIVKLGTYVRGYVDQGPGTAAKKEMGCLMEVAGQGIIQLRFDPKSDLASLGLFEDGQFGFFWDATAHCQLTMTPN